MTRRLAIAAGVLAALNLGLFAATHGGDWLLVVNAAVIILCIGLLGPNDRTSR